MEFGSLSENLVKKILTNELSLEELRKYKNSYRHALELDPRNTFLRKIIVLIDNAMAQQKPGEQIKPKETQPAKETYDDLPSLEKAIQEYKRNLKAKPGNKYLVDKLKELSSQKQKFTIPSEPTARRDKPQERDKKRKISYL